MPYHYFCGGDVLQYNLKVGLKFTVLRMASVICLQGFPRGASHCPVRLSVGLFHRLGSIRSSCGVSSSTGLCGVRYHFQTVELQ